MAITDAARRNRTELFPDHVSTFAGTDPELIERFDNWAFGDVLNEATQGSPAVNGRRGGIVVEWMEKVTDEAYRAGSTP